MEIIKKGIEYLGITDRETIKYLIDAHYENIEYRMELELEKQRKKEWDERYNVPRGLEKKELKLLLKDTQQKIDYYNEKWRDAENDESKFFIELIRDNWIEKKKKINNQLKFHNNFGSELNITKAKQYPIEQLIEFNTGGFTKCIHHDERTPSLKLYRKRNKAHCFSCGVDMDSIDVYQKINNVDFNQAVKALCQKN